MGRAEAQCERLILDRCVLTTMTAALVLAVLPWLWGLCSLQIPSLPWTMAGFALLYWVGASLLDRTERPATLLAGTVALQASAVLTLTWTWHLAGGVFNWAFLWSFAPILLAQSMLLPRWLTLGMAVLSCLSVLSVALAESDGLRLLAYRHGLPLGGPGEFFRLPRYAPPFEGLADDPSHSVVALVLFGGFAFVISSIGRTLSRLTQGGRGVDAHGADHVADLFRLVVDSDPSPRVIVRSASGAIVHMSPSFRKQMLVDAPQANLFDVIRFAEPADCRHLFSEEEAELARCRYVIGPEERIGRVRAHRVLRDREPVVSLTFEEILVGRSPDTNPTEPAKRGLE